MPRRDEIMSRRLSIYRMSVVDKFKLITCMLKNGKLISADMRKAPERRAITDVAAWLCFSIT